MSWRWKVYYRDFAGEWCLDCETRDIFVAMLRYAHWHSEGHAAKMESGQILD